MSLHRNCPSPHTNAPPRRLVRSLAALGATAGILAASLGVSPASAAGASAAGARSAVGWVEGTVTSAATGGPVAGASVALPDFGLSATSERDGRFRFEAAIAVADQYRRIRAVVRAPGFGTWTLRGAPLFAGDTLRLDAALTQQPFSHSVKSPRERARMERDAGVTQSPMGTKGTGSYTCTGWASNLVPPKTISVYRTATKVAERYPFSFYVAHVLPNEWIASWDYDALAAGAMAVKTYAWYRAQPNHGYSTGPGCADLVDTVSDQVFDPTWSNARTDLATDATLGTTLQKSSAIFLAQYWAGSKSDPCAPVTGTYAGRMSQWGTQSCALIPMAWPDIVSTFYTSTSLVYTNNLFLNPYVEDPALYPWVKQTAGATMTRKTSGGKNGPAYLQLANAGMSWTLYQLRPYLATAATAYHLSVALKCESVNATNCTATLKVIAGGGGITKVTRSLLVTIPKDGTWHTVTFDPAASGVVHTTLQVNFVSKYTLGIDAASITTPYDQPA